MSHSLESIGRELQDLRGLLVKLERGGKRKPTGTRFIAQAAAAIFHHLKDMDAVERWQQKAATSPAMTSVTGWAAELAQSVTADYVLSLGGGVYAAPSLFQAAHGYSMSASVKAVIAGSASASFVGEGQPIGLTKAAFSSASFQAHSIKAIASFTEEMSERTAPQVETLLRTILNKAVGSCLDSVLFDASPSSAIRPAGLLNGITATTGGATFQADIAALMAVVKPANPVFITGPGRRAALAAGGDLLGFSDYSVLSSEAVPDTRLILVDADDLSVAFGGEVKFSVSRSAVLVEQDQAGVVPFSDGAGTIGAPARSLWQTDSAALRAVLPTSWVAAPGAVAYTDEA
ncbi:phage major capsid protein [Ensifer sp. SSB1]|jgi:hypothetical protein|uniref:phage major capsid protein n=1 Tax=Ensifer sp. SSB1 TaxID=2795385 RepID=UPI001A3664E3|nr:phage major capsid protein [Ensifer sp. SSB1]MBK5567232.1 phage major capsid protein [Ensifer sp. SSB1]